MSMTPENKESEREPYQNLCSVCKQNRVDNEEINSQNDLLIQKLRDENYRLRHMLHQIQLSNDLDSNYHSDTEFPSSDEASPILACDQNNGLRQFGKYDHTAKKDALIKGLKNEIVRLNRVVALSKSSNKDMDDFYKDSFSSLAFRRLPALYLTLFIELVGGLIITKFEGVIRRYTLLVSFMPALSALSGNDSIFDQKVSDF